MWLLHGVADGLCIAPLSAVEAICCRLLYQPPRQGSAGAAAAVLHHLCIHTPAHQPALAPHLPAGDVVIFERHSSSRHKLHVSIRRGEGPQQGPMIKCHKKRTRPGRVEEEQEEEQQSSRQRQATGQAAEQGPVPGQVAVRATEQAAALVAAERVATVQAAEQAGAQGGSPGSSGTSSSGQGASVVLPGQEQAAVVA